MNSQQAEANKGKTNPQGEISLQRSTSEEEKETGNDHMSGAS